MNRVTDAIAYLLDVVIVTPAVKVKHFVFGCPPDMLYTDFTRQTGVKVRYCLGCNRVHNAYFGDPHA